MGSLATPLAVVVVGQAQ